MARPPHLDKRLALQRQGTLNPRPQRVAHELFRLGNFFDKDDLVQVKYEMLRLVLSEQQPITTTTRAFGLSRPSFYQALAAFREAGMGGLMPRKRGPRRGHKLNAEIVDYLMRAREKDPSLRSDHLARLVNNRFGVKVHPRSIRKLLAEQRTKRSNSSC